ncbi:hypothetical protein PSN45_004165 [Yamadazyma tenuis]|nr:hypothetical protein PSN45_004165 [Yamadazyma tenuis]
MPEAQTLTVKIRLSSHILRDLDTCDSDLSSLELELNKALETPDTSLSVPQFPVTLRYSPQKFQSHTAAVVPVSPNSSIKDEPKVKQLPSTQNDIGSDPKPATFSVPATPASQAPSVGSWSPESAYRTIPPNLILVLRREFGLLNETAEEMSMIEKIIFTLRDPLSATRIGLPVKAVVCNHFECFDFDNFCVFNRIPTGIKTVLRKDLIRRSNEMKKRDKQVATTTGSRGKTDIVSLTRNFVYKPNISGFNNFRKNSTGASQSYPIYRCPVCNKLFELNHLFISDVFNYFIKTTPSEIDRIELRDMVKYRIVEDDINDPHKNQTNAQAEEVIELLSDDDDTQSHSPQLQKEDISDSEATEEEVLVRKSDNNFWDSDDSFDDSFEESYRRYQDQYTAGAGAVRGSGSWEDPVTLD